MESVDGGGHILFTGEGGGLKKEGGGRVMEEEEASAGSSESVAPLPSELEPESYARSYQLEALDRALRGNTIAYLETGSGKTLIAIMLLRAYAHMLRHPSSHSSIAVFLVPTVVLVSQQAHVISLHTDLKVGKFWGEMGVDFWSASHWKDMLQTFEVFVMTPQILLDNLRHSFFGIEDIKLLIFDECHHARGRHPYACIMTEFYHRHLSKNSVNLPRIFGMTASPIKSKAVSSSRIVYSKQIIDLESLLNSKVYTVANESVLSQYVPLSTPRIQLYKHVDMPYGIFRPLVDNLKSLKSKHLRALQELSLDDLTKESAQKKILQLNTTFLFCLTELGAWLTAKAAQSLASKETHNLFWGRRQDEMGENIVRKFSKDVFQIFSQYLPNGRSIGDDLQSDVDAGYITCKVCCLIQCLLDYRRMQDMRCIVFVERVITAIVLQNLLSTLRQLSGWGIEYMAGNHSGLQCQSRKEQIKIVDAFRIGKVNLIVATQILEEGLDVQSCNVVIRFDPSATICSFIQSRGRARMHGSEYVLIIRSGDGLALSKVSDYLNSGDIMREESLRQASFPCQPLDNEMYNEEYYCVESTGAIVTLSSSVSLIYFYCSSLPSDRYFKATPIFLFDKEHKLCTLNLPKSCSIQTVQVEGRWDKIKKIACLEACKRLHQVGDLTDDLLPVLGAAVEDGSPDFGAEAYVTEQVNYFPGELVDSWSSFCVRGLYHCYRIGLSQTLNHGAYFSDIFLVVKANIGPEFVSHSFCLGSDRSLLNLDLKYLGLMHLSSEQVLMARRFQVSVLGILIHHNLEKYKDAITHMEEKKSSSTASYLLLPSSGGKVDWQCVKAVDFLTEKVRCHKTNQCCSKGTIRLVQTKGGALCSCTLQNSIVYTPHSARFYFVNGILDDLDGNSSLKLRSGDVLSYKEYYLSRHGIRILWENESLLAARDIFTVPNLIVRTSSQREKESSNTGVELPPELCIIIMSPVSINTLYTFSFIPASMHRIQRLLLASILKNQLGHCLQISTIPSALVLEAITTKKCLEAFSLESLETLGDSFLKYAVCHHLYRTHIHCHEGILSAKKDRMISNAALCRLGCARNIAGFILNEQFNPKVWSIPGDWYDYFEINTTFCPSSGIFNKGTKCMKSKVIADSVEALVGAYLSSAGELAAFLFLDWLGMDIKFQKEFIEWPGVASPEMYVNVEFLESLLEYKFHNPSLLVEALTHGSYQIADIPRCYQRLEFLGDAILDHLITVHLYNKYPGLSPGLLTDLRSASVNNDCYAHAAVKAGLNKHIIHASMELHKQMTFYLNNFVQSFSGSSYGWDSGIGLPKVLGDIIESLSGAIYVDSGYNKEIVWRSISRLLEPIVSPETIEYHPVRELEELCSRRSYKRRYSEALEDGIVCITAEIEADGTVYEVKRTGTNKNMAKKLAAKALLECLRASNPELGKD